MTSLESDLGKMQLLTNHPVHVEEQTLSASALIPFCWVGNYRNIGENIDEFNIPVCRGFEKKIRNDQLCYEFNPGSIIKNGDVKKGLHLFLDENKDRTRFGSLDENDKVENLQLNSSDENEGIKVYLDAIGY